MNGFEIAGLIIGGTPVALLVMICLVAGCYGSFTWVRDFRLADKIQAWRDFWKDGFQVGQLVFILILITGLVCMHIGSNIKKDVLPDKFDINDSTRTTYQVEATSEGLIIQNSERLMYIEWNKLRKNVDYANYKGWGRGEDGK